MQEESDQEEVLEVDQAVVQLLGLRRVAQDDAHEQRAETGFQLQRLEQLAGAECNGDTEQHHQFAMTRQIQDRQQQRSKQGQGQQQQGGRRGQGAARHDQVGDGHQILQHQHTDGDVGVQ